jgi:hypothetical protein
MLARRLLPIFLLSGALSAGVVRVEIQSRADVLNGRAFGLAGPYEKLVGRVYFAVDPANPINGIITDLDKAPRNAEGKVEFSSDLYILRPKQADRGNGAALYEVSNRGGKGMLAFFNHARGSLDPTSAEEFGDGFLLNQGYTLVWLGWQWDPPQRPGLMRLYAPRAPGLKGLVRSDFVLTEKATSHMLSDREHIPYLVADPNDPSAILTVRAKVDDPRRTVPRAQWKFSADRGSVEMASGFEPHRIYEVVYTSEDPVLAGLGSAAVRDFFSHVKGSSQGSPIISVRRAYAFGVSQSGRFLRTYLYYGFNQDEKGQPVFDGVMPHVAGGGRGSFNVRYAQPSRDGHPWINFFYPSDIFPFTDEEETDPDTGWTDGLLLVANKSKTAPRIFYTNSSYEYWGRAASLIHTSPDGRADAKLPDNVRIYQFSGGQHGPAGFPPTRGGGRNLSSPNDYKWSMRALLVAMDHWVKDGTAPPASVYPRIAGDTLVKPEVVQFPKIPGIEFPKRWHLAYRADYGPDFKTKGIVTNEPPKMAGKPYTLMVSQVDADGNETGGLRMPEVAVPLATYTGWNQFNGKAGPAEELTGGQGSFIPFPRTKAEREKKGDPRRSIEERYHDRDEYLGKVSAAAMKLIDQGYLLPGDMPRIMREAGDRWDWATNPQRPD